MLPLPDPLPPAPPIPYGYLLALSKKIDVGDLAPAEQVRIIDDLRRALRDEQTKPCAPTSSGCLPRCGAAVDRVVADREIEDVLAAQGSAHDLHSGPTPAGGAPGRPVPDRDEHHLSGGSE